MTDAETALRDALAAVAEALTMPAGAWQERSDRAIIAAAVIGWILTPGADIPAQVRHLRETIAARDAGTGGAGDG
jgi:hypothetical protein